jgi:hypothetical protein
MIVHSTPLGPHQGAAIRTKQLENISVRSDMRRMETGYHRNGKKKRRVQFDVVVPFEKAASEKGQQSHKISRCYETAR